MEKGREVVISCHLALATLPVNISLTKANILEKQNRIELDVLRTLSKSCPQLLNIYTIYYPSYKLSASSFRVVNVAARGSVPKQPHVPQTIIIGLVNFKGISIDICQSDSSCEVIRH